MNTKSPFLKQKQNIETRITNRAVGLDFGNFEIKIVIDGKKSKVPARYAFDKPVIVGGSGKEAKIETFPLLFKRKDETDLRLWFGRDVLASQNVIQEVDTAKYEPGHISRLFQAALYQWSKDHKIPLSGLGKMNIVVSMPPGLYQKSQSRTRAERAYRGAFNRGQSHVKIRDGKETFQIVTQFGGLVRETVTWGKHINRNGKLVLVMDLGGGTNDIALFNGSPAPIMAKTLNTGLLHTYSKINPANPDQAELKVIKNKSYLPPQLVSYYNRIKNTIQTANRELPRPVDVIYLVGGGAALMPNSLKSQFKELAKEVIIKDEYINAMANWKEASKC